jgi:hypothetical protein
MKTKYNSPLKDKDGKFLFTKELKDNWLKALRSGDYEQFNDKLKNSDNNKQMCCLGVLADIHPNIRISKNGENCIVRNKKVSYDPFDEMKIHNGCPAHLASRNDNSYRDGKRDYSEVIPLIETLPTID